MTKSVGIIQSNYIPWKGYFDFIDRVDEFIILDDAQYTKRDWRNRNVIKSPNGPTWLTIPTKSKGKFESKIEDIEVAGVGWADKHWSTLSQFYKRANFFSKNEQWAKTLYEEASGLTHLSEVNALFRTEICTFLGITTPILWSRAWPTESKRTERLIELCQAVGADEYVSGPSAKSYLEPQLFEAHNIKLRFMEYSGYPEYPQLWGDFVHNVSILDVIFNVGEDAASSVLPNRQST